jgi:hypothetical protein
MGLRSVVAPFQVVSDRRLQLTLPNMVISATLAPGGDEMVMRSTAGSCANVFVRGGHAQRRRQDLPEGEEESVETESVDDDQEGTEPASADPLWHILPRRGRHHHGHRRHH